MKGQLHTDIFMSSLLKKSSGIRKEKRLVHIFAIFPQNQNQEPLLISDAAVNVFPDEKTQKQSIQEMILLSKNVAKVTRLELVTVVNKNNYVAPLFTFKSPKLPRIYCRLFLQQSYKTITSGSILSRLLKLFSRLL